MINFILKAIPNTLKIISIKVIPFLIDAIILFFKNIIKLLKKYFLIIFLLLFGLIKSHQAFKDRRES